MKTLWLKKLAHLFLVVTALAVSSLSITALNLAKAEPYEDNELDDLEVQR
jgi:hypothetical protein